MRWMGSQTFCGSRIQLPNLKMGVQIVSQENHIHEQSKPLPREYHFFNLAEFRRWTTCIQRLGQANRIRIHN